MSERENLERKLDILISRGVQVLDRRQTFLDEATDPERVCPGVVLYPGTRLMGPRTFIGPGARVGTEGPAVLDDTLIGADTEIASGYLKDSVMLRQSRVGSNAHVRVGTLLEEEASTAHT